MSISTTSIIRVIEPGPRFLGVLLLTIGLLGTGCGTSNATRDGGSASASRPERPSTSDRHVEEKQSAHGERTAPQDEPVEVLRLQKVRSRLEDTAENWYGVPYKWGGESKQGVDCSGFVLNVYEEAFAYRLPRVTEMQLQAGSRVSRDQIQPGDLVFFQPEDQYNHVGVYLGDGTFVHASSSEGVTKAPIEKNYWDQYYWTARRPLKPSTIPDALATDLLAYQYPDTTGQGVDAPEPAPNSGIASCSAPNVDCADPSVEEATASAEPPTRKGW